MFRCGKCLLTLLGVMNREVVYVIVIWSSVCSVCSCVTSCVSNVVPVLFYIPFLPCLIPLHTSSICSLLTTVIVCPHLIYFTWSLLTSQRCVLLCLSNFSFCVANASVERLCLVFVFVLWPVSLRYPSRHQWPSLHAGSVSECNLHSCV